MNKILLISTALLLGACGTMTNNPNVPVALSFSDGSDGTCKLSNKRMALEANIPSVIQIRRSDDNIIYNCVSDNGKVAFGGIASTIGAKHTAGAIFLDLGITDAITDMSREYPASYVIPLKESK